MEIEDFLRQELAGLTRFAAVLTGNRQDAQDVLNDALVTVIQRWGEIERATATAAYVRKIVTNTFLATRRTQVRRKTWPARDPGIDHSSHDDVAGEVGLRDQLHRLIDTLPPRQRAAIVLRFYLDMDDTEAARTLGVSASAVRSSISRALHHLRLTTGANPMEDRV